MNRKFRFILKRSFFLILIVLIEIYIINSIFNFSALDERLVIAVYAILILPVVLLYLIFVLFFRLVFSRYNLRKANKFQTRLIFSFALIAIIPIIPLIFLTNNLLNESMEIWLTKSTEQSLGTGLDFGTSIKEEKEKNIRHYLKLLGRNDFIRQSLIPGAEDKYKRFINQMAKKNMIDSLFIINNNNEIIYESQSKKLIRNIFIKNLKDLLSKNNIFIKGRSNDDDEYFIGYSYIYDSDAAKNIRGLLVIGQFLPENFSDNANRIALALQSYKQMQLYKKPIIQGATTFIIIIMTLIVFLVAIIVSYIISKNITEPIKILLDGTKRIVAGDLNFEIKYNAKDEIKLLINAFNHMTRELLASKQALTHSQRLAAWRDIARRIAHEIRNPLTPIKLSVERLVEQSKSKNFNAILKKSSKTILDEVNRLDLLIGEFSEFAKIPQLHFKLKSLNHIIIDTLNVFSGVKSVSFKTELEKDLPILNLDDKRIKEVLINLINNSIEAIDHKNGIINIMTYSKVNIFGKFVCIEIKDNGRGISKDKLVKIFDPYFTTKKDGTGLGLAIVEKVISEHHAKIKCESEVKKGTKYIIEFTV